MGVDLKMLVLDGYIAAEGERKEFGFAHTVLEIGGDYDYHNLVLRCPSRDVPENFSSYVATREDGEQGYGQVRKDCYGHVVKMVRAGDLAKIKHRPDYDRLRAAIAYVKALSPDTWVALYWH